MNVHLKVQSHHLRTQRLPLHPPIFDAASDNTESAMRQYALRGRAIALGWREEQIIVIDNDRVNPAHRRSGVKGSAAGQRCRHGACRDRHEPGGLLSGAQQCRLAASARDLRLADTLILDEDGIYDPASFNDRLLLGLKGTMSEAELHVIKARLRGGILNKARRGEFRCPLPTGLVYDYSRNVALEPDMQIRETIVHFFETFSRVGSASQTVNSQSNRLRCSGSGKYSKPSPAMPTCP